MSETARPLGGLRILLVDDEEMVLVAKLLEINGAEVLCCQTVADAREQWTAFRPLLLISGLAMPGENGLDLIPWVRQLPPEEGGELPAIAFSAITDPTIRERALECGFQAVVSKLDVRILLAAVIAWTPGGLA
jgi:CheY-like chemotaxis protein